MPVAYMDTNAPNIVFMQGYTCESPLTRYWQHGRVHKARWEQPFAVFLATSPSEGNCAMLAGYHTPYTVDHFEAKDGKPQLNVPCGQLLAGDQRPPER
jgi:hypothetical protein